MNLLFRIIKKVLDFWSNLRIIITTEPTTPLLSMRTRVGHFYLRGGNTNELKPALKIKDQVTKLSERGLIIDNNKIAEDFLSLHNYYHLNIYFHKFMDTTDHFYSGTTFSHIIEIYRNDSWLRNRLLTVLEPIEIKTQTQTAYYLGIKYGADVLYQKEVFKSEMLYQKNIEWIIRQLENKGSEPIIKHHNKKYGGRYPIWAVVELLSFTTLSNLFVSLNNIDKNEIARRAFDIDDHLLRQWLQSLCDLRNICAHYGYLYKRIYPKRPMVEKTISRLIKRNDELFAYCLVIKRLSEKVAWENFIRQLEDLENLSQTFRLADYGFQENWRSFLL